MKLGKMLLVLASLAMLASFAEAKVSNKVWKVPKTTVAPKLDGQVDSVWNAVDGQPMQYFMCGAQRPSSWSDISGWCKLLWDDNNIYGLFYTMDDVIDSLPGTDWQMDAVEFYTDAGNTHATTTPLSSVPNAYQFCMRVPQSTKQASIDSACRAYGHGMQYKWFLDTAAINHGGPSGSYMQFQYPLDSLGIAAQAGTKFSLQLQQDDNDATAGNRIHISKWANSTSSDDDWQNTLHWGDAQLVDATTGEGVDSKYSYVLKKTSKVPSGTAATTVDGGPADPIWSDANQLNASNVGIGSTWPVDPQDQSWRFYGLWDDKNLYGFFIVYDDVVNQAGGTDWQMDGVEFYTDAGNTHSTTTPLSSVPGAYQFCMRPPQSTTQASIDSTCRAYGHGMKYAFTLLKNTMNDSIFSSMGGYAVEFSYPLDSLGIVGADGTPFSLELQTDDNDATAGNRIHITKWWNTTAASDDDWQNTLHWGNAKLSSALAVVAVKENPASVASSFKLEQNYPNPFNPTTQISYSIARSGFVTLKVYNVLGQEVATLFSGNQKPGSYIANFDAARFSSGVYLYKLQAGNQLLVKKMMLLK